MPGAVVTVSGVKADSRVKIGGKRAKVLGARRVVVPEVPAGRAVIRIRGGRRGQIVIRKAFRGRIGVVADAKRAAQATIGPAGGTITATRAGDRYVLTVPPEALPAETPITVTPLKSVSGLPVSGRAVGVRFAPEGLQFARPAALTVNLARKSSKPLVGFTATSAGRSAGLVPAVGSRQSVTVAVPHFSVNGAASAAEADAAAAAWPMLNALVNPTQQKVEQLGDLMREWERLFPGFCGRQEPLCRRVIEIASEAMPRLIQEACDAYTPAPSMDGIASIAQLNALGQLLGVETDADANDCIERLFREIATRAVAALAGNDPFVASQLAAGPPGLLTVAAGLDGDTAVTNRFEWVWALTSQAELLGADDARVDLVHAAEQAVKRIRETGLAMCDTDETAGEAYLRKGHRLILEITAFITEMEAAITACRLRVEVSPSSVTLEQAASQQFTHTVTNGTYQGVTWSATGGTISDSGLYTAPNAAGDYTITATSQQNPTRKGTATVHVTPPPFDVKFDSRYSSLIAAVDVFQGSIRYQDIDSDTFRETGAWTRSADADQSFSNANGSGGATATASQTSNVVTTASSFRVTFDGATSSSAHGPNSTAHGSSKVRVAFVVGTKPHPYTLTGSRTTSDVADSLVTLSGGYGNEPVVSIVDGNGGISSSGTLAPGGYTLEIVTTADSTQSTPSGNGSLSVELAVTP